MNLLSVSYAALVVVLASPSDANPMASVGSPSTVQARAHTPTTPLSFYAQLQRVRRNSEYPVAGDPCKKQSDCSERDIYCDEKKGVCAIVKDDGEKCKLWYECVEEYLCFEGKCQYEPEIDQEKLEKLRLPLGKKCVEYSGNPAQQCKKDGYCKDEKCVKKLETGAECDQENDYCADGLTCRMGTCRANDDKQGEGETCESNWDCEDALRCKEKTCVKRSDVGKECEDSTECLDTLSCRQGKCRSSDDKVGAGEKCESWADCQDGYDCKRKNDKDERTCEEKVGEGETCETFTECKDGLSCRLGKCRPDGYKVEAGERCDVSEMCPEGYWCNVMGRDDKGEVCEKRAEIGGACKTWMACPEGSKCKDGKCAEKN